LLVAALGATVGLSEAGWVLGITCAVLTSTMLARSLSPDCAHRLGPADWVTLARATLAVGVAALVADSFDRPAPGAMLVTLAAVALALDAVDGWVARRSGTASKLGARFDGEVDAFLILVLSVYVARSAGVWVLAIGAARYLFLAAGWLWPWLREPLPPRYWRKVVCATQGIVLTIATADVLPPALNRAALLVALALLAESFGRDVWWLRAHRRANERSGDLAVAADARADRGRVRTIGAAVLTTAAALLVWVALVAPDHPSLLTPVGFARIPLEGIVGVALILALPAVARRPLAWVVGPALGLLLLVRLLDLGLLTIFDRRFDPVSDWRYTGIVVDTLSDSIGQTNAILTLVGVVVLVLAVLALTTLAVRRLVRVADARRRWSLPAVSALAVAWVVCWAFGAQLASGLPVASTSTARLAVDEMRAIQAGIEDHAILAAEIGRDRFRDTPGDRLLTDLHGKDVILAVVESYGRAAVEGSSFSAGINALLDEGTERLRAAGFLSRSAFLTSPTFGGASWLAHSTLQTGIWVKTQQRYDQLLASDRLTLGEAFQRAGWRTVGELPANDQDWPEGSSFYHFDQLYDQRNLGYQGPTFAFAPMPDQYVLAALQRRELAERPRSPVFAEVNLVSTHAPWTRIPELIDWDDLGDGSVFEGMPAGHLSASALWSDPEAVRAAYGRSVEYTLNALISFVLHYGDERLVLVVLGDHQPSTVVTGRGANPDAPMADLSHDVPISIIARDPAVLDQIGAWGWEDGLRPSPQAPVWRMDAFRDRFLGAFGSQPS
jgi:phosphatidylglycerophosphate synthase